MTASHVTVRLTGKSAGLAGLATCGSVWADPVCNAKIMARRAVEVGAAVALWQAQGGRVAFVTLTMRHRKGQSLEELWGALGAAWNRVTGGKAWIGNKAAYGIDGWLRVVEVTRGRNGWHVHIHSLLFVDAKLTANNLMKLHQSMFARWRSGLVKLGLEAPLLVGQDSRLISGPADASLAGYFTKATDNAHRIGLEFTQTQSKTARTGFSTESVWSLLDGLLNTGEVEYLDGWHEWERGSKGRKQMTWSMGMRDRLGLVNERTDEEIAEEEIGTRHDDLVRIDAEGWSTLIRRPVLIAHLLNITEQAGIAGLQGFLAANGVSYERNV